VRYGGRQDGESRLRARGLWKKWKLRAAERKKSKINVGSSRQEKREM